MQLCHMSRTWIDSKATEPEPLMWDAHCVASVSDHRIVMSENEPGRVWTEHEDTHEGKVRREGGQGGWRRRGGQNNIEVQG